jgi:hypothetical protein
MSYDKKYYLFRFLKTCLIYLQHCCLPTLWYCNFLESQHYSLHAHISNNVSLLKCTDISLLLHGLVKKMLMWASGQ